MKKPRQYLFIIFLIGFSSLTYEIYSTRILFFFFPESTTAVTIAISAFLAGLACSSLLVTSYIHKIKKDSILFLYWMQIFIAVYAFFLLKNYLLIPNTIEYSINHTIGITSIFYYFLKDVVIWLYLFIPAFFIGGAFPIINGLYLEESDSKTKGTSVVYFWDTIGSVLGTLFTGFLLLPYFGFKLTCLIAVIISLFISLIMIHNKKLKIFSFVLLLVPIFNGILIIKDNYNNANKNDSIVRNFSDLKIRFGDVLFQKESSYGTVTVGQQSDLSKRLYINYRDMCSTSEHYSEDEIASFTLTKNTKPISVLNIGLGCGFTAAQVLKEPFISHLDIIEINPVVIEANTFFAKYNNKVLQDNRTTLLNEDGATYIQTTKNKYGSIIIDIEEPNIIYSSPLYTKEYFQYAHDHLTQDGTFSLWAQFGSSNYGKVLLNTLSSVYKYVDLRATYYPNHYGPFYTFFASDTPLKIPPVVNLDEQKIIDMVKDDKNTEINTIDNKVLEKYFNSNSFFNFNKDYTEPFFQK